MGYKKKFREMRNRVPCSCYLCDDDVCIGAGRSLISNEYITIINSFSSTGTRNYDWVLIIPLLG